MRITALAFAICAVAASQTQSPTFEIAYVAQPAGGTSGPVRLDIMLARSDGTGARVIASETMAGVFPGGWSPDGARLVLHAFREADEDLGKRCRGHFHFPLYVTTLAGGAPDRLAELMAPPGVAWSPDSRSVALVSACEDPIRDPKRLDRGYSFASALYIVDVATKSFRRLTGFERFHNPSWSPDGRRITFKGPGSIERESGVYVIDADGKNQRRIADGIVPRWSPRGDLIAYGVPARIDSDR